MARKKQDKHSAPEMDLECIDIFYIPKPMAEMYRVLREAVAEDLLVFLEAKDYTAKRVNDNTDEGEAIIALDSNDQEVFRFFLNPTNISASQEARDKEEFELFIENQMKGMGK